MTRLMVIGGCLAIFTLAAAFAGVGVMMRLAIANGSYNPILDDGYAGTIDDFNAALLRKVIAACLVGAASGAAVFLTRPARHIQPITTGSPNITAPPHPAGLFRAR